MSATDWNELDGYEALVSELRATAPAAPEHLRDRVLAGAPTPRRRRSRRQRLFLVVVPVACVLAVGAALVHGFVNSGSKPSAAIEPAVGSVHTFGRGSALRSNPPPAATTPEAAAQSAPRALKSRARKAPQSFKAYTGEYDNLQAAGAPLAKNLRLQGGSEVIIPRTRLVHATASLQVQVKDRSELSQQTNKASQIVGALGGYAQSVRYQASHQGYGEAFLALRVPVQKAQTAIAQLGGLGKLLSQQVSTQDLQAKLTQQTSAIGSLRRAIAVYESALQSSTLPASQRAILQIRLNNARRALAHLRHARTGTLASGATADISLLLTTRGHAVVAPQHHGSTRIGRLLGSAAHFLALEGIIVLYALIVLAPVLLIGGLVWWLVRERRRREERLLASA